MKISIRHKITIIILILILISVSTLGILTYNNAEKILLKENKLRSYKTLQNVNDYFLKNFIQDMEYTINYWSEKEELKKYHNKSNQPKMVTSIPEHFEPVSNQWTGYITSNPDIAWLYMGIEEDGSLFITPLDPTMPQDYDCRKREWYRSAAKNHKNTIWTNPYLDAGDSGEIIVTVAKAVTNQDKLIGVVGMDIKLKKFSHIIKNIHFGEKGYLMLLGKNGDIYAHPNGKMLTKNISKSKWAEKILSNTQGTDLYTWNNQEVIVSYLTVPQTQWKLVGIMPVNIEKLISPIRNKIIIVGIISIIVTFLIGYFLSLIITNPVSSIMKAINELSMYNFNVHLKINSNDEFKILGEKFNDMIHEIKVLLKERDIHVNELTKKNIEISSQKQEILAYSEETEALNEELSSLIDTIKKNYLSTVSALANAIEASDKYTRGHCDRVRSFSVSIGERLSINQHEINNLEFASILHDIGKIGIPSFILNKEGALSYEEFKLIEQHPQIGYEMLKDVDFLQESRNIFLQHHERIDGKGYPNHLKGSEINLLAKILMVADSYDAMTSSRPYRKNPLSKEQAIKQLQLGTGSQFDEKVVNAFLDILKEDKI